MMRLYWQRFSESTIGRMTGIAAAITAVMVSAIHPLTYGLMPATPDGLLHLYRLVALDHAIQNGDLWPRYVPGFLFGYGAPVFNYYAPLSLYPPEMLHLIGFRFLDALLISMIICALFGAIGAYLLGRVWAGPVAGIITAAAYAYAPYILYDWPRRGAVAEFAALALLPWVLWGFWRLAVRGRRRLDLVLSSVLLGALILTHNITALYGMAVIIAYCAYLWWISPEPRRAFVRLGLAGFFALGLTVFFWLPALAESRYVYIDRVTYGVANLDFHNNFQSITGTLAPPLTADLTQLHPPVPRALGWPQIILAVIGGTAVLWRGAMPLEERQRLRGLLGLSAGIAVVLLFLTTRASTFIWEVIPLMHYIQFPWRLLGPLSLIVALWAGIGAVAIAQHIPWWTGKAGWAALCVGWMAINALPWLYGAYLPDPPAAGIVDAQNFERQTGWLAGTAAGEYVPVWTTQLPDANRLLGLYAENDVIPRLQPNSDLTVESMEWRAMGATLSIDVQQATTLVFDWLYFPGWWAELDGNPIIVEPMTPQGFVAVTVPEGQRTLEIGFGPTPLRLGAMITSGVFLGGLALSVVVMPQRTWGNGGPGKPQSILPVQAMIGAIAVAGIGVFLLKALWLDNAQTPVKRARFAEGIEAGVETPVQASFNREVTLLGYDLAPRQVRSGRTAKLALYWQLAGEAAQEDYSSVIYLRDTAGNILQQIGSQHPGDLPITQWLPSLYIQERLILSIPPGTPPGIYSLHAALYSHASQRNIDVFDAAGAPTGVSIEIGTLEVLRPLGAVRLAAPAHAEVINKALNEVLVLQWAGELPHTQEVGQAFTFTSAWRAEGVPAKAYQVQLVWLDDEQVEAVSSAFSPVAGYPTTDWQSGDHWRGVQVQYVPGRLDRGEYDVAIQLVDEEGEAEGERVVIGQMAITTPQRNFELPDEINTSDALWENLIKLSGYELEEERVEAGDALNLTLYWQAGTDVSESLTAFVHLVNENGAIFAQQDQIPVRGARPTTGWAPEEVIEDVYQIFIPPDVPRGSYSLRIGWYNALTNRRILMADGTEFWVMPEDIHIR